MSNAAAIRIHHRNGDHQPTIAEVRNELRMIHSLVEQMMNKIDRLDPNAGCTISERKIVTVIIQVVATFYDYTPEQITARIRPEQLAWARHVAMYFARRFTGLSLEEIGKLFGGRDHGTVMCGVRRVEDRCSYDAAARQNIAALTAKISQIIQKEPK